MYTPRSSARNADGSLYVPAAQGHVANNAQSGSSHNRQYRNNNQIAQTPYRSSQQQDYSSQNNRVSGNNVNNRDNYVDRRQQNRYYDNYNNGGRDVSNNNKAEPGPNYGHQSSRGNAGQPSAIRGNVVQPQRPQPGINYGVEPGQPLQPNPVPDDSVVAVGYQG